jgi:hypothetical protein
MRFLPLLLLPVLAAAQLTNKAQFELLDSIIATLKSKDSPHATQLETQRRNLWTS